MARGTQNRSIADEEKRWRIEGEQPRLNHWNMAELTGPSHGCEPENKDTRVHRF
jgi:hypothetical protein